MNLLDVNGIPTLLPDEKFYGFLPSELPGVWTCRRCGTVAHEGEQCSYCYDINRFPLTVMMHAAKAALLDCDNEDWLLSKAHRLRIYYGSINVQTSA